MTTYDPLKAWEDEARLAQKMMAEGSLAPHPESDQGKALRRRQRREGIAECFWGLVICIAVLVAWGLLR